TDYGECCCLLGFTTFNLRSFKCFAPRVSGQACTVRVCMRACLAVAVKRPPVAASGCAVRSDPYRLQIRSHPWPGDDRVSPPGFSIEIDMLTCPYRRVLTVFGGRLIS
ncbi:hypothetical protein SRHO_G00025070, partial [Serrasalmus rhombeus]